MIPYFYVRWSKSTSSPVLTFILDHKRILLVLYVGNIWKYLPFLVLLNMNKSHFLQRCTYLGCMLLALTTLLNIQAVASQSNPNIKQHKAIVEQWLKESLPQLQEGWRKEEAALQDEIEEGISTLIDQESLRQSLASLFIKQYIAPVNQRMPQLLESTMVATLLLQQQQLSSAEILTPEKILIQVKTNIIMQINSQHLARTKMFKMWLKEATELEQAEAVLKKFRVYMEGHLKKRLNELHNGLGKESESELIRPYQKIEKSFEESLVKLLPYQDNKCYDTLIPLFKVWQKAFYTKEAKKKNDELTKIYTNSIEKEIPLLIAGLEQVIFLTRPQQHSGQIMSLWPSLKQQSEEIAKRFILHLKSLPKETVDKFNNNEQLVSKTGDEVLTDLIEKVLKEHNEELNRFYLEHEKTFETKLNKFNKATKGLFKQWLAPLKDVTTEDQSLEQKKSEANKELKDYLDNFGKNLKYRFRILLETLDMVQRGRLREKGLTKGKEEDHMFQTQFDQFELILNGAEAQFNQFIALPYPSLQLLQEQLKTIDSTKYSSLKGIFYYCFNAKTLLGGALLALLFAVKWIYDRYNMKKIDKRGE